MRRRRAALLTLLLLAVLVAVPVVLTWQQVRQERLNHALIAAVDRNDTAGVRRLLRQGANPTAQVLPDDKRPIWALVWDHLWYHDAQRPHEGEYALYRAIIYHPRRKRHQRTPTVDNVDTVQALVEAGADVNAPIGASFFSPFANRPVPVETRTTALIQAIQCEKWKVVRMLLAHHADINATDQWNNTPLYWTVDAENAELAETLLCNGADIAAMDSEDSTLLLMALDPSPLKPNVQTVRRMVACLLRYGASVRGHDSDGNTVLSLARNRWHDPQLIQMLKRAGAKETGK